MIDLFIPREVWSERGTKTPTGALWRLCAPIRTRRLVGDNVADMVLRVPGWELHRVWAVVLQSAAGYWNQANRADGIAWPYKTGYTHKDFRAMGVSPKGRDALLALAVLGCLRRPRPEAGFAPATPLSPAALGMLDDRALKALLVAESRRYMPLALRVELSRLSPPSRRGRPFVRLDREGNAR